MLRSEEPAGVRAEPLPRLRLATGYEALRDASDRALGSTASKEDLTMRPLPPEQISPVGPWPEGILPVPCLECRLPLCEMTEANQARLRKTLEAFEQSR